MSMSKRLQIPISEAEEKLLRAAARRRGLSLAEWARRHLKADAQAEIGLPKVTPEEALKKLFELDGPVASIEAMIEQSLKGRYK